MRSSSTDLGTDLKIKLTEIETGIIAITGDDPEDSNGWQRFRSKRERVSALLLRRCVILNDMFVDTEDNMCRFLQMNDLLLSMTMHLHERVKLIASILSGCAFDREKPIEVEGWIRTLVNGSDSVSRLEDDERYGSRFGLMIKALHELEQHVGGMDYIAYVRPEGGLLDDGPSWDEYPFRDRKEFRDIVICHAIHDLCNHKYYSIPDLLHLKEFRTEITFTEDILFPGSSVRNSVE